MMAKGSDMNDSRIMPVFQVLAEDIHALGIRTVFGLMSDDTAVFAVTLDGLGVKFVGARHENNAIAMAEGYAYSTGELGVAIIGRGPATANGLHAAVAASRMGSKVLVIYGDAAVGSGAVNGIGPDVTETLQVPYSRWVPEEQVSLISTWVPVGRFGQPVLVDVLGTQSQIDEGL